MDICGVCVIKVNDLMTIDANPLILQAFATSDGV